MALGADVSSYEIPQSRGICQRAQALTWQSVTRGSSALPRVLGLEIRRSARPLNGGGKRRRSSDGMATAIGKSQFALPV